MSVTPHRAVLESAIAHWNAGDLPGYLRLYDPAIVVHGYPGIVPGIDSVRGFYESFLAAFPRMRLVADDIFESGDRLACRFRCEGTHGGPFMGMPATGRAVTLGGITILRFRDGRCAERWSQADFLGLMQQLGMLPSPG